MKVVTSSRRQIVMAVLLVLAAIGGAIRHWADNPSLLRDIGTLMLVLWLPAVGNLVGFAIRRLPRRAQAPRAFATDSPFTSHLRAALTPVALWPEGAQPLPPLQRHCTLLLGREGFTARLAAPLSQWLAAGAEQTLELELLRPALALPRLAAGTAFALLAGTAVVGHGLVNAQEEVPFITSPDNVTLEMLRIANVGPGDHVIDLGSGDGRIVILAARKFDATGLGVEIVPGLVQQSIRNAQDAGVAGRVSFREQDLFTTDLSAATVVTMYLLPDVNLQLRPSLLALKPGTRVVSHDWDMGDWQPDRTVEVPVPDKQVGRERSSKIHLWVVPAQVGGLWCGAGLLRGTSLQLSQRHQEFAGTLRLRERSRPLQGRIEGATVRTPGGRAGELVLELEEPRLRIVQAAGPLAPARGAAFTRATGAACS